LMCTFCICRFSKVRPTGLFAASFIRDDFPTAFILLLIIFPLIAI
jgi:hypothetical protein